MSDCSSGKQSVGPLETYNSLTDENLSSFFANSSRRHFLQRMGLITPDGRILDEESIRRYHSFNEHRLKAKHTMAEALVNRAVELEKKRRGMLKKKMDLLTKYEITERTKHASNYPRGVALLGPTHSCPPQLSSTLKKRQEELGLTHEEFTELNHMINHMGVSRKMPSPQISPYGRPHPPTTPRTQQTTNMAIRAKRIVQRPQTAPSSGMSERKLRTNVLMTFQYLGGRIRLSTRSDLRVSVEVYQQHCGGNNICLYKGKLLPREQFTCISRRNYGTSLGLSLYTNGLMNCRMSSCCEYKHKPGSLIGGGKLASFRLIRVEGGRPCYRCQALKSPQEEVEEFKMPKEEEPTLVTPYDPRLPSSDKEEEVTEEGGDEYDDEQFEEDKEEEKEEMNNGVNKQDKKEIENKDKEDDEMNAYSSDFESTGSQIGSDQPKPSNHVSTATSSSTAVHSSTVHTNSPTPVHSSTVHTNSPTPVHSSTNSPTPVHSSTNSPTPVHSSTVHANSPTPVHSSTTAVQNSTNTPPLPNQVSVIDGDKSATAIDDNESSIELLTQTIVSTILHNAINSVHHRDSLVEHKKESLLPSVENLVKEKKEETSLQQEEMKESYLPLVQETKKQETTSPPLQEAKELSLHSVEQKELTVPSTEETKESSSSPIEEMKESSLSPPIQETIEAIAAPQVEEKKEASPASLVEEFTSPLIEQSSPQSANETKDQSIEEKKQQSSSSTPLLVDDNLIKEYLESIVIRAQAFNDNEGPKREEEIVHNKSADSEVSLDRYNIQTKSSSSMSSSSFSDLRKSEIENGRKSRLGERGDEQTSSQIEILEKPEPNTTHQDESRNKNRSESRNENRSESKNENRSESKNENRSESSNQSTSESTFKSDSDVDSNTKNDSKKSESRNSIRDKIYSV